MPRATNAAATRARTKRTLFKARGMFGNKSRLYRYAKDAVNRAEAFAYIHRKQKKRTYRALWIVRLNAAVRQHGMSYSRFINGLAKANVQLDRKALSELAIHDEAGFAKIVATAKAALATVA